MTKSSRQIFLEELFSRRKNLQNLKELSHSFPVIHIAGTNGKGSVAHKIAGAYREAGYKVGLYTSPHLIDYEERIQINGEKIPKQVALEKGRRLLTKFPTYNFFEITTLMAFEYFEEQKIEIGVIEAGLGGRLDATCSVKPILTIITSIGLDHTEYLGETLEEIAEEKGGIIKDGVPLIVGPSANYYPKAHVVKGPFSDFENENSAIAKAALLELGLPEKAILKGLEYRAPCRFEKRGRFIFDAAHNPAAFEQLVKKLPEKIDVIIGMCAEKDWKKCLEIIEKKAANLYCVEANNPRALSKEKLASASIKGVAISLEEALKVAKATTLICGSFYVMEEAIRKLESGLLQT